ncbi:MAG: MaoC/PaaZ C-terminal domain-containing protein [Anaerolineales bacterium]|jgi:acyl dehydratase|nr:MaoC/PaaZ C-terminal domain-containing protein [Anaerolineales bacterium]|tara:strand:+ start:65 stop:520 length:456 start_codon:yes stop_codon:yes gene_type:complete
MANQQRGLTFDQFNLGDVFTSQARTVTETDVVNFAGLSGDFNPLHTDEEFGKSTPFGARIAHGMLVASMATGMANWSGVFEGTTIALMEQVIRYKGAVMFGDTVHLELTVAEKKETSKPNRGIVKFDTAVVNQDGKAVIEGQWTLMMARNA